ncbi:hypothetical protein [Mycolicibacterium sp. 050158]|nr:hypothetical protein [Mycolicibacterium sp. 050158]MDX1888082.1 hypothetical protein [Mycolicibacterium sp. 050158]
MSIHTLLALVFPVILGLRAGARWLGTVGLKAAGDAWRGDQEGETWRFI